MSHINNHDKLLWARKNSTLFCFIHTKKLLQKIFNILTFVFKLPSFVFKQTSVHAFLLLSTYLH